MFNFLAQLIYQKYQPKILVISGTSGKTTVLEILKDFLKNKISLFATSYHKDHRQAIYLTFLLEKEPNKLKNFFKALYLLIFPINYPELIILEFGFEDKKVVNYWLRKIKIDYLIITNIGEMTAYSEVFVGPESIKNKKSNLVKNVKKEGLIIINGDDLSCLELVENLEKEVVFFGLLPDNDFRAENIELICNLEATPTICGTSFLFNSKYGKKKIFLRNLFGKGIIYSTLAVITFLFNLGYTLEEIGNYFEKFTGVKHRLTLIKSKKGYYILDDSFHLTPYSFWNSFDIFKKLPSQRKILLIGDCLTAGKYSLDFHFDIAEHLKDVCDFVISFGNRSKFTLDSLYAYGFELEKTKHFYPTQINELLKFLENLLLPNDLILIIGDKRLNLHKIVDYLS